MMTPKEKAKELVNEYIPLTVRLVADYEWVEDIDSAKQCALIAVNKIMEELDLIREITGSSYVLEVIEYYLEVKQEIGKL